jgi:hypothetical protein
VIVIEVISAAAYARIDSVLYFLSLCVLYLLLSLFVSLIVSVFTPFSSALVFFFFCCCCSVFLAVCVCLFCLTRLSVFPRWLLFYFTTAFAVSPFR